jgi:hypothetical protein
MTWLFHENYVYLIMVFRIRWYDDEKRWVLNEDFVILMIIWWKLLLLYDILWLLLFDVGDND